ncbi:YqcC family protein [Rheinheimera soli]|uniref:YqcC family protein n=1 Tax=Rheinheimera soli TaxID=443616 RepID=UPI001E61D0C0|nr:YqcC family protein [Rheinheimera soli]
MYLQVTDLLNQIERELKAAGLWALIAPSAEAMQSTAPFFCDTMPLENWLQFVFLPRMRALVEGSLPLPQQIAVCPMAEEAFKHLDHRTLLLINRIADLDELLSGKREQSIARA